MASSDFDAELENTVGYRFIPSDEELVNHFLRLKTLGIDDEVSEIPELDVRQFEPWDLPGHSKIKSDDQQWYFFSPRTRKDPKSPRTSRTTKLGYWKVTGKDRKVKTESIHEEIGIKKTLVYYEGRSPNGVRTNWVIHEYHPTFNLQNQKAAFVLCKLKNERDDMPNVDIKSSTVMGFDQDPSSTERNNNVGTAVEEDSQLEAHLNSFHGCDEMDYNLNSAMRFQMCNGETSSHDDFGSNAKMF